MTSKKTVTIPRNVLAMLVRVAQAVALGRVPVAFGASDVALLDEAIEALDPAEVSNG